MSFGTRPGGNRLRFLVGALLAAALLLMTIPVGCARPVPRVAAIAAGDGFCCALKSDGTVWAWGSDFGGQLGDGSTNSGPNPDPVQVRDLQGVTAIAAGYDTGYTLKTDGTVWAWGDNQHGGLGDGSTVQSSVPVPVTGLTGVVAIAAGCDTGYALEIDGTVRAWGANGFGQLGDGTAKDSYVPVRVLGLGGVRSIAAGYATAYALKPDGSVWTWGLGHIKAADNSAFRYVPVQVAGLTGTRAVADGGECGYALESDGTVRAWGADAGWLANNPAGEKFTPPWTWTKAPVPVPGLTGATAVAAGAESGYALKADDTVWAWGRNEYGQLGNGSTKSSGTPVRVSRLTDIRAIASGFTTTYALEADGTVWAWGRDGSGETGNGSLVDSHVPVPVSGLTGKQRYMQGMQDLGPGGLTDQNAAIGGIHPGDSVESVADRYGKPNSMVTLTEGTALTPADPDHSIEWHYQRLQLSVSFNTAHVVTGVHAGDDSPLKTNAGIGVGSSLEDILNTYPGAKIMRDPSGNLSVAVGGTHKEALDNYDFYYPQLVFYVCRNRVIDMSLSRS